MVPNRTAYAEAYDTFGPGMVRLDDPIEADIWNNKYFVWEREL